MNDGASSEMVRRAKELLTEARSVECPSPRSADLAIELASVLVEMNIDNASARDRDQAEVLARLMNDPRGQVFTTLLTDRAYRSRSKKRVVEQARYLLELVGTPSYVGAFERLGLGALRSVGSWLPTLSGTAMLERIRGETSAFILPAGAELDAYLAKRSAEGTRVNVNHLGEEVLGEHEAEARLEGYLELLARPGVETLSVKISSIFSQLDSWAFDRCVARSSERLHRVFMAALENRTASGAPKLVMLDMEAYRDAELTLAAFKHTLDSPKLRELSAGIALQAYLPETSAWHEALLRWARERRAHGGARIRTRIVKGANLAMERVEAAERGWQTPVYPSKADVDAHFKRMLLRACTPENLEAAEVGIASHNLFDVCFGLVLRSARRAEARVSLELLEGMANPLLRSLRQIDVPVLVYAPIVSETEFPSAIAYLVRRLDENTAPENYLHHSFSMSVGSPAWKDQEAQFRAAHSRALSVGTEARPRRSALPERPAQHRPEQALPPFENEPDSDFATPDTRATQRDWLSRVHDLHWVVRSRVAGRDLPGAKTLPGFDPSRPGHEPYLIELAADADVRHALETASRCHLETRVSWSERSTWLRDAAKALRAARHELTALMLLDSGKRVQEADVEVSEAIDFAEYYARTQERLERDARLSVRALGPVVITPPWNFPLAIPLGGVFASLAAGNPVILKPALETPLVARRACELLWQAGIDESMLQLVVCEDDAASELIRSPHTRAVILTGSTSTARLFFELRPELELFAETGGKNGMFVSAMSDHEQAILDVVASAFGHAGQKCSALSQLVLDRELHADHAFLAALKDATSSLKVGSAWESDSVVTPLIHPPSPLQRRALTELEPGESWLVRPRIHDDNPRLVSPGIKLGVKPGSQSHVTEFFCPLLAVLDAKDVAHAVDVINATPYGLTAGIHSLDEREQELFIERIHAGNVYVNRKITGAVVRRQPFGGWKESCFGPGAKAGGPNYTSQLCELTLRAPVPGAADEEAPVSIAGPERLPERVSELVSQLAALLPGPHDAETDAADVPKRDSVEAWARTLVTEHTRWYASPLDESGVRGEDNYLCYRPLRGLFAIAPATLPVAALVRLALTTRVCGCPLELSVSADATGPLRTIADALGATPFTSSEQLATLVDQTEAERIWSALPLDPTTLGVARRRGLHVLTRAPFGYARLDLWCMLREQAVSVRYHRYGHLGLRAATESAPPRPDHRSTSP